MKNKKAFTLIELLVVIAVMAGLLALLVPNFMQVRIKARDVRRKSDLKAIQKALEMYKLGQSTPIYPAAAGLVACAPLSDANNTYMQVVPQDPLARCPTVSNSYSYVPAGDLYSYKLSACLEDPNDPEKVTCPAGFTCSSGKCYQLTNP